MSRVERIGDAELWLGDCREILPTLSGVDAVVTDPPYGIGWKPRTNHTTQIWFDDEQFDPTALLGIGRYHLFWGAQYFARLLPHAEGWVTWVKRPFGMGFSNDQRSYATTELAWRDWGKAQFVDHVWDGGMRAGVEANRTFCHPSQKPVEVMDWCIRGLPKGAGTILDPYLGSGTTGISCARLGYNFIGVEREPTYFDIACRRIEQAQRQKDLFVHAPIPIDPAEQRAVDLFAEPA